MIAPWRRLAPGWSSEGTRPSLEEGVWGCLREIHDPCSLATGVPLTLEEMGLESSVEVGVDGDVHVHLRLTSPSCMMVGLFVPQIEDRVQVLPDVRSVEVTHDTGMEPPVIAEDAR